MQITNLTCVYLFLPLCLFVYYLVPRRGRAGTMLGFSLLYFLLAQPGGLWTMLASVAVDYLAVQVMARWGDIPWRRRACVAVSALKNLAIILWMSAMTEILGAAPQLGLMVFTLSGLDTVLSVYRGETDPPRSPVDFGLHCCFFPKLYAGPLSEYRITAPQTGQDKLRPGALLSGAGEFVQGAAKNAVLGGSSMALYQTLRVMEEERATVLSSWALVLTMAFAVYFIYSGFSDMARGIGRMAGVELPKNFYYPYQSRSVEDFFHRFNITVNSFFQRNVYRPLKEDRNGPLADAANLLLVGVLMGLWFGFRINYLLWGVYLAVFIILEKYLYPKLLAMAPTFFCRVYALCVVLSSFTIFASGGVRDTLGLAGKMVGVGVPLNNDEILYLLSANWLLLVACVIFSTSAASLVVVPVRRKLGQVGAALLAAVDLVVLVLFTALTL